MIVPLDGLTHAEALQAPYNCSKPLGMGVLHYTPEAMTGAYAEALLSKTDYFDYLKGRVMKVRIDVEATEIDCSLYDRDNGEGAGKRALDSMRAWKAQAKP